MTPEFYVIIGSIIFLLVFFSGYFIGKEHVYYTHKTSRELDEEEIKTIDKAFEHFDNAMNSANKAFDEMRKIPRRNRRWRKERRQ